MKPTLAIPVHNDMDHLGALLRRAAPLGCFAHVVVVDDGSAVPVQADAVRAAGALRKDELTLLRNDTALGPGPARNRALDHVPTDHLLYLDADDLLTRELPLLLSDLDGQDFDFCIFRHHDTRMEQERYWGPTGHDQALWQAAGADPGALGPLSPGAAALLAGTANYPWNKIYRTAFLRDNGIGCGDIPVHEDIELHWHSFLRAGAILASDRIAVVHVVNADADRLTNRSGPERLQVFATLDRIAAEVSTGSGDYALSFFDFALGLFDWIPDNLAPGHLAAFDGLVAGFVATHISPALLAQIAGRSPDRTRRVMARAGL